MNKKTLCLGAIVALAAMCVGNGCFIGPTPSRMPSGSSLVYSHNGSIWQITNASKRPNELLAPAETPNSEGQLVVNSHGVLASDGVSLIWVRCSSSRLPEGRHVVHPKAPWVLGVTNLATGVEMEIQRSDLPIELWRWDNSLAEATTRLRNPEYERSGMAAPLYEYFGVIKQENGSFSLAELAEEESKKVAPGFAESRHGAKKYLAYMSDWTLDPQGKWMFFTGREQGMWGYWFYGGYELSTGEEKVFRVYDKGFYKF